MISATLPENERSRLKALYDYHVLDTEAEHVFDGFTELASQICGTPIALISLIDPDRQWFKSKVGLSADETSRDIAFCAHAIHQQQIFEINDTSLDERFKDNPLVTEAPNIRFYAGAPLITPDGFAIGTLCAISDKPNKLDDQQRKALSILSKAVITQLELRSRIRNQKLENEHKTDFLSTLSHELRTPLNAIISFNKLLLNDENVVLPDHQRKYLEYSDYSGKRLLRLVNGVLDLNKIESGNLILENKRLRVDNFFDSVCAIIQPSANHKSIKIAFTVDKKGIEYFDSDETRLSQILINLMSNAIKFSEAGTTVNVNVVLTNTQLTIAVRDEGKGIAEDDIPLLFKKFKQLGKASNQEGSGLGLMITKSIVDLMNGTIRISSQLGQGSLFKVGIPLTESSQTETSLTYEAIVPCFNKAAKILVVEDNYINQKVIKAQLQRIGLVATFCANGEDAVESAKSSSFDLIFMDLHLPKIDGFEASKQIITDKPSQKIVALSADVFAQNDPTLTASGMLELLSKPITECEIVDVLNRYCSIQTNHNSQSYL